MHGSLSVRRVIIRGCALTASLGSAIALVVTGSAPAGALPQPSIAQVQHELSVINSKLSVLGQQYDEVLQQLSLANERLGLLDRETKRYRATFDAMRLEIDRIAAVAYEQGGITSPLALLTSGSPQTVLDESSILGELSAVDSAQVSNWRLMTPGVLTFSGRPALGRMDISLGALWAR